MAKIYEDFDVIALENAIEQACLAEAMPYVDDEIEVDESPNCPKLYRVWAGRRQLGTFFRSPVSGKWEATPFYLNGKFADSSKPKAFKNSKKAQAYIVKCWEG